MPDGVYSDDHMVFNDLKILNETVDRMKGMVLIKPIRIEEGVFKNGKLVCKKILQDFSVNSLDEDSEE
jgi:hypothetical protein